MNDINKLRRLAQEATPGPWKMVPVGDGRQKFAVADSEYLSILTVTDEGEATFGTVYHDADAKFIAAANPAAILDLLDRLEVVEKSDAESIAMYRKARDERDALRAKITEMEQQEPVTWMQSTHLSSFKNRLCGSQSSYVHCSDHQLHPDFKPLYALPGAQKVPSVPEREFLERVIGLCGHRGSSPSSIEAFDPEDKWIADLWRQAKAMLAAAPEAKP